LAWPGKLGKPVLAGNRATYADVHPGVDLVVDALRTGCEQFLIIKTPAALVGLSGGGADVSWSLPVKTKGLTARVEAAVRSPLSMLRTWWLPGWRPRRPGMPW
jgi:hypothetical protein